MNSSWVEISRSALKQNLRNFKKLVGASKLLPVIKSNAYGHGLEQIVDIIKTQSVWGVAVAATSEALMVRKYGYKKPVLVLSYTDTDVKEIINKDIRLAVYSLSFVKALNSRAVKLNKIVKVHLNYDSGGTRLGLTDQLFIELVKEVKNLKNIKIEGVFSWLADSEEINSQLTNLQLKRFNIIKSQVHNLIGKQVIFHITCTASNINYAESYHELARVGIGLYGLWPSVKTKVQSEIINKWFSIKPVLSWYTKIIQIKTVPARTSVSYGRTYTTKRRTKIAVLPIGYWEGYDRGLSNKAKVIINGKPCPVRGKICMNLTMVDISNIKNVKVGDKVILIGKKGKAEVTADELAEACGTINYEIVTRINPTIKRITVK
ncbi:alanine racemase [Patescibacteria group bacterium]